jgi:XTP/dITP diphosphohydrolase
MITLVIATRNAHKVGEIRAILGGQFRYLTLRDFSNPPEVVEDAATFAGNATKKSVQLAAWISDSRTALKSPLHASDFVLADDSGLEVDALNGAPGVHSARFAALDSGHSGNSPDAENNAKLLRLLKGIPLEQRAARFRCVLALTPISPSPRSQSVPPVGDPSQFEIKTELLDGVCEGRIGFEPRGAGGFGYDPLFFPAGYDQSFGELGEQVKNRLSHRAKALEKLRRRLGERFGPRLES